MVQYTELPAVGDGALDRERRGRLHHGLGGSKKTAAITGMAKARLVDLSAFALRVLLGKRLAFPVRRATGQRHRQRRDGQQDREGRQHHPTNGQGAGRASTVACHGPITTRSRPVLQHRDLVRDVATLQSIESKAQRCSPVDDVRARSSQSARRVGRPASLPESLSSRLAYLAVAIGVASCRTSDEHGTSSGDTKHRRAAPAVPDGSRPSKRARAPNGARGDGGGIRRPIRVAWVDCND